MIINIILLVLSIISLVVSIIALNNGLNKSKFDNMFIDCTNKMDPLKCRHAGPQCQWNSLLQGGPYGGLGSCQQSLAVPGSFGNSRIIN
jgi:hypothetical protein